jgi:hypothetical protein
MLWPKTEFVQAGYSCPTMNEVVTLGPIIHNPINARLYLFLNIYSILFFLNQIDT